MKDQWTNLLPALSPECRRAMEFLYGHLPESDLDCYPVSLFREFADHALMLRSSVPWCAGLEEEVFHHYVLFPRVNDEDLSFYSAVFFDALWLRIRDLSTMEDRILEVNRWCHEMATYQMQDDRTASPLTVFRNGSGRCGEESAFLVAALRSVGIPARQVYAPRWAHCDDNHAWVEALCGGKWRFLGACEPEPVLDRGWFNTPSSKAILVHSRIFGEGASALHGEFLCREGGVCWYNQTARYARVKEYTFRVLCNGLPAAGAKLQIQVLNEASFHTIATLTADENGEARVTLGLGDFHVLATLGDLRVETNCAGGDITLHLAPCQTNTRWTDFDVHAPKSESVNPSPLDAAQRASRAAELRRGKALREARTSAFFARENDLLRAARGNAVEIAAFLEADDDPRRETLLRTLSEKDLRDVTAEILEDHLQNAPVAEGIPEDIYNAYVLCPRIQWESLTPWRHILKDVLPNEEPAALWDCLTRQINTQVARTYANLVWTPAEAWRAGRCDERSLRLLYVALLRSHGTPARLRVLDGMPEYWENGAFQPVCPSETGTLRLTYPDGTAPVYRQNWTLSAWTTSGWKLLGLTGNAYEIHLPAGAYRLTTSVRLPNGNQYGSQRELTILPGEVTCSDLRLRSYALEDMLGCQELPVMSAVTLGGTQIPDFRPNTGRPGLLFWLEEGAEPTEHILNELLAQQQALEVLPVDITFLLQSRDSLNHPTLAKLLDGWKGIQILLDDWHFDLEAVARCLTCDPDTPPLAVVCDSNGQAVYGVSGYRVGSVEILTRIAAYLIEAHN